MDYSVRAKNTEKRRDLRKRSTQAEKNLWIHLRTFRGIGFIFRRQHSIDWYIVDFYCPKLKLAIEVDGSIHDIPDNQENDKIRDDYISKFGIVILRFKNDEVLYNSEKVLITIRSKIDELIK